MLALSAILSLALALGPQVAAADELPPPGVLGRYEFTSTTLEGDPFSGIIHITGTPGAYGGRILTNVQAPIPILGVDVDGPELAVRAEIPGAGPLLLQFTVTGNEMTGHWELMGRTGQLEGKRFPAHIDNNLPPVPCRAAGLREVVRCATYHVYEDRASQSGRKIALNIVVLPAENSDPLPDPLFTFAGGPGQAATAGAGGNAQRFANIRRTRDIVMVDQRGTGGSNGLACEFKEARDRALVLLAWVFPPEDVVTCRNLLERRANLGLYHTAIAVDDIDEVREWLGYDEINIYGGSYGTRAALTYMRQHPNRVRTATIRGVMPPQSVFPLNNPKDAQVALKRVFDDCAVDERCHTAFPEIRDQFDAVFAELAEAPATIRVFDPLQRDSTEFQITQDVFAGGMRRLLMSSDLQRRIPMVIQRAAQGDLTPFGPGITQTLAVARSLSLGMGISVMCAEESARIRARDIAAETAGTFLGSRPSQALVDTCEHWPTGTPPVGYDRPVTVDAPTLVLSGALDPTTPARWGAEAARHLPNSLHLVMEGISHSPFPGCAQDITARFVAAGTVERLDVSCGSELRRPAFMTPPPGGRGL